MRTSNLLHSKILILGILLLFCNSIQAAEDPDAITDFTIQPDYIDIGAFFKGAQIVVSAEVPQCDGVVIELEGEVQEMTLNRKGRRAFLWLNVDRLTVENAPSVYILACSDRLNRICTEQEMEEELLGYVELRKKITFESEHELNGHEFDEFVRMKEHNGSYNITRGVEIDLLKNNRQRVTATIDIPSFIPAGNYEVFLYSFRDGNLLAKASANFIIEEVGLTRLTKKLAFGKPAIYGVSAIIAALTAGIFIGLVFSRGSGGGH
jgi:uncharacterized protein (TIGR02186 family)